MISESETKLGEAKEAATAAQSALADLEHRIDDGDSSVTPTQLLEARTQVEITNRRTAKAELAARSAQESERFERVNQIVNEWETRAPELRSRIREAAERVTGAHDELEAVTIAYNAELAKVTSTLQTIKHPQINLVGRGRATIGREHPEALRFDSLLKLSLPSEVFAIGTAPLTYSSLPGTHPECVPNLEPPTPEPPKFRVKPFDINREPEPKPIRPPFGLLVESDNH